MLSKVELLKLLVALIRMSDSQVISTDEGLPIEVCAPGERDQVRHLRGLLIPLRRFYDYTESPEFLATIQGKSEAVAAMQRKLTSDPTKKKAQLERLDSALERLMSSSEVFELVGAKDLEAIQEAKRIVAGLSNPD